MKGWTRHLGCGCRVTDDVCQTHLWVKLDDGNLINRRHRECRGVVGRQVWFGDTGSQRYLEYALSDVGCARCRESRSGGGVVIRASFLPAYIRIYSTPLPVNLAPSERRIFVDG